MIIFLLLLYILFLYIYFILKFYLIFINLIFDVALPLHLLINYKSAASSLNGVCLMVLFLMGLNDGFLKGGGLNDEFT